MENQWVQLSLFSVTYPKDDIVGYFMAIISLLPFAIVTSYVTLCLFNRDLQTIFMFGGQIINEIICLVLKKIFKQNRPMYQNYSVNAYGRESKNYGMPSQHSQFQAYFSIYCILFLVLICKNKSKLFRFGLSTLLLLSTSITIYSRIYLVYHYWYQCLAGVFIGSIWATIWFYIVYNIFEKNIFPLISSSKIGVFFGIVNTPVIIKDKNY